MKVYKYFFPIYVVISVQSHKKEFGLGPQSSVPEALVDTLGP